MRVLETAIYDLLKEDPFYANFLLGCKVIYDAKGVERAAVSFRGGQICFLFNTQWYTSITREERVAVLVHEVLHAVFDHIGNRAYGFTNQKARNYAMDCAINQFIRNLPKGCVTLDSMSELVKKKLSPFETYEYYYHQLKQAVEDYKDGETDDHDHMDGDGEGEGGISESERSLRRARVRDLFDKAVKASAGNIPKAVSSALSGLTDAPKVNWRQQLRNIVCSAKSVTRIPTRSKVHRRFELEQPGKKKERKINLSVCVDSSGSVSDEAFMAFMTEIYGLSKLTTNTFVIHADTEVQRVDVIKGGTPKKDMLEKRHCNGGTAYQPAITEALNRESDLIIYFGDMDSADVPVDPKVPFIWVRVGKQKPPADFGRIIDLD